MRPYPVATHLNNVGLAVLILTKWPMPSPTTDGISVFEDGKVMDRGIGKCLLVMLSIHHPSQQWLVGEYSQQQQYQTFLHRFMM